MHFQNALIALSYIYFLNSLYAMPKLLQVSAWFQFILIDSSMYYK